MKIRSHFFRQNCVVNILLSILHILYRMRWAGHVARMGEERRINRVLLGKPEGRRPLGRPRRRWVGNIRMDTRRWDVGIWTGLGWPRIETGGGRL